MLAKHINLGERGFPGLNMCVVVVVVLKWVPWGERRCSKKNVTVSAC